ncbi:MmgE/PrpD family protein [Nesterenkonia populi]|uniref:MmgE/PrpD family protein n=1 Tax=Nesterenkonia populi TaxID=1591087 RepID=UPI0011BE9122|nr:MmgE/PrpD family protein [Nesterenkonia populi]
MSILSQKSARPPAPEVATSIPSVAEGLAEFAAEYSSPDRSLPPEVSDALDRVLENTLAVMLAGASTEHCVALAQAWGGRNGVPLPVDLSLESACWLGGVAAVSMEMDEGHREAGGHPAAQCFPAVLSLAAVRNAPGWLLQRALLIAYEVTARIGSVADLPPEAHPHGTAGAVGAAAGCAALLGLPRAQVKEAIRAGLAMPIATSWSAVHAGGAVRDQWVGAANLNGLNASRFAASGLQAGEALGLGGLGRLDRAHVGGSHSSQWFITGNYFKRHSACAYLHGSIDAVLKLRQEMHMGRQELATVRELTVEVPPFATDFCREELTTRHSAWFSIPFAVSSALLYGDVSYVRSTPEAWTQEFRKAVSRVRVRPSHDFSGLTSASRPARVTAELEDGRAIAVSVDHPCGDQELTPFEQNEWDALTSAHLAMSPTSLTKEELRLLIASLDTRSSRALTDVLTQQ